METDNNDSDNDKMDIKMEIKEEPNETLPEVKSECEEFETVLVSSEFVKDSEMCNKIEIKEEPCCSETTSSEIKQEMDADVDLKETASHTEVITGDEAADKPSRLLTESMCRNIDSTSCFFSTTKSGGENSDPEASSLLSFQQTFMLEEPERNLVIDSYGKDSGLTPNSNMQHKDKICAKTVNAFSVTKDETINCDDENQLNCENASTGASVLKGQNLFHEGKKLHQCSVCNKKFIQVSSLKQHILIIHEGRRPYTCEICKRTFTRLSSLNEHKLIHEGKRPHICEICNKSFTHASTLKQHKLHHEGKRLYVCEICKRTFIYASNLGAHKSTHEDGAEHTCEICNKTFTRASDMKKHELIHGGKRRYKCEICNKSFNWASSLKAHKSTHEPKEHKSISEHKLFHTYGIRIETKLMKC